MWQSEIEALRVARADSLNDTANTMRVELEIAGAEFKWSDSPLDVRATGLVSSSSSSSSSFHCAPSSCFPLTALPSFLLSRLTRELLVLAGGVC